MAWIATIGAENADEELRSIYDEIISKRGKLSNIMEVQSLRPQVMRAHLTLYMAVMFGRSKVSRADRELIATVVSNVNGCSYCVNHHAAALDFYWKNSARISRVLENHDGELDEKQLAIVTYAVKLTRAPDRVTEADVIELRDVGYTDMDILDVNFVISYFNFVNRIASGLGVEFDADEVAGYEY